MDVKAIDGKKLTYADVKTVVTVYDEKKDDEKKAMEDFVTIMDEFNGAYESAAPGVGAAYIPVSAYFHVVTTGEGADKKIVEGKASEIVELFYNWKALGKDRAALYGAAIRYGARGLIDLSREVVEIRENKIPASAKGDFETFRTQLNKEKQNAAVWAKQFPSIIAMNGACLIAIAHHWDSNNLKPWTAIVQSLGQADVIEEGLYRTMFYLALHPIPLATVERLRAEAAEGKKSDYVNAVSIRARCTPATTGALMVCSAAIPDLMSEPWAAEIKGRLHEAIQRLATAAGEIRLDPAAYCPLAGAFGKERKVVDIAAFKLPMIILTAYIMESVKGTLARSMSLKKFTTAIGRPVPRWRALIAAADQVAAGTLIEELRALAV
jgi:hypothetical protein